MARYGLQEQFPRLFTEEAGN